MSSAPTHSNHLFRLGFPLFPSVFAVALSMAAMAAHADTHAANTIEGELVVLTDGYEIGAAVSLPQGRIANFRYTGDQLKVSYQGEWLPGATAGIAFKPDGSACFTGSMQTGVETDLVRLQGNDRLANPDGNAYAAAWFNTTAAANAGIESELCWSVDLSFLARAGGSGAQRVLVRSSIEARLTPSLVVDGTVSAQVQAGVAGRTGTAAVISLPQAPEDAALLESYCLDEDWTPPGREERLHYIEGPLGHIREALAYISKTRFEPDQIQDFIWEHQSRNAPRRRLRSIEIEYSAITGLHLVSLLDEWGRLAPSELITRLDAAIERYRQEMRQPDEAPEGPAGVIEELQELRENLESDGQALAAARGELRRIEDEYWEMTGLHLYGLINEWEDLDADQAIARLDEVIEIYRQSPSAAPEKGLVEELQSLAESLERTEPNWKATAEAELEQIEETYEALTSYHVLDLMNRLELVNPTRDDQVERWFADLNETIDLYRPGSRYAALIASLEELRDELEH